MARGNGSQHDTKRETLAAAALQVARRQGIEALTFRNVAAGAGVSLGQVQHYFTDRADLVRAAFHRVQEQTKEHIEGELAAGPDPSAPAVVSAILRSLIPLTPSQLADHRVAQDFEMYALRDPDLLQELRVGHSGLVDFLTQQLAGAHDAAATTPRADPARTILTLIATAEGLAGLVQIGHLPSPVAMDLLNTALADAL